MNQISFFTTANYGNAANTFSESLLDKVDNYFFLWGRKVQVIPGYRQGNSEGVVYTSYQKPSVITALKVVSYVTLILPLIAIIAKIILRTIHKFHLIPYVGDKNTTQGTPPDQLPPRHIGTDLAPPPNPPNFNDSIPKLDFDTPVTLTCDEVVKLQIKPHAFVDGVILLGGISDLKEYKDSWFEYRWIDSDHIVVTRRRLRDDPFFLLFNSPRILFSKEVVKHQLRYVDANKGVSDLYVYRDSYFHIFQKWIDEEKDFAYTIIRKPIGDLYKRDYRYIPLRSPIRFSESEFRKLNMEVTHSIDGWVLGRSNHREYVDCLFAWKECDSGIVIYRY